MKTSSDEVQMIDAIGCAVLKFRNKGESGDLICEHANGIAKKILGDCVGRSWADLSAAYSPPLRFDDEVLKFPDGKEYQVVKKTLENDGYVFTLLDVFPEDRVKKEIEDFLFIASHDLQEPLRKIVSFGERLERNKQELGEENNLYLSRMLKATGRMQSMLTGLLAFSHIGKTAEGYSECDLGKLVNEAFADAVEYTGKATARLEVDKLPVIEAASSELKQLFKEIFVNSIKFQPSDAVPEIDVASDVDLLEKTVKITVKDNGIGFDGAHAERIFQPFHRLNGRSAYEGAGIGLAICKKIVEKHAGEIKAYSATGKGTTLEVILPLQQRKAIL